MNGELTFIELFAGIGGFRLGLERAGWNCIWANELDKHATTTYCKNFGSKELIEGDIKTIEASSIPKPKLIAAGFPCQPFSTAGQRKGFQDIRGTLFFEIARIAESLKPELLLLENVKGLLSAQEGYCFLRILEVLDELGYNVEWKVLNSKHWLPQNRERTFIVGHLRAGSSRAIFPKIWASDEFDEWSSEQQVANALQSPGHACGNYRGMNMIVQPCLTPDRPTKRQNGRRFKENGEPMFTLTGQDIHGVAVSNCVDTTGWLRQMGWHKPGLHGLTDYRIRRLTPKECERLQGFPDGWTEGISETQRYKTLGNAVTVPVIQFLGEKLKECLD